MYIYNYNFSYNSQDLFYWVFFFYTFVLNLMFVHDDIRYLTYKKKLQWYPTVKARDTPPVKQVIQQKWHSH